MPWLADLLTAHTAPLLALLAAALTGVGIILAGIGLRKMDPLSGAAVSIPCTCLMYWLLLPTQTVPDGLPWPALLIFAVVGLVYPAAVTLLQNLSYLRLGPTPTATISATAPFFAIAGAVLLLREPVTLNTLAGATLLVSAIVLISWRGGRAVAEGARAWTLGALSLPVGAAAVRGLTQIGIKLGLVLLPSPFVAGLIGYSVSTVVVLTLSISGWTGSRLRLHRAGVPWFVLSGANNGCVMLALYTALQAGTVSQVAPIAASFPIFTALYSVLFYRSERVGLRLVVGGLFVVAGVAFIVR